MSRTVCFGYGATLGGKEDKYSLQPELLLYLFSAACGYWR
jgi:hypothetical protein